MTVSIMAHPLKKNLIVLLAFGLLLIPARARCMVLTADTTWSGEVSVDQDILVPEGVTLTILPGTTIRVAASESTKTDPEYLSPLTEITVRGTIIAEGKVKAPVTFVLAGDKKASWAGIIIDRGKGIFRYAVVSDADTGLYVIDGSLALTDSRITRNRYGLTLQGKRAAVHVRSSRVEKNDYGVLLLNGATIDDKDNVIAENRKRDRYEPVVKTAVLPGEPEYKEDKQEQGRIYGDEVLRGTTIWQGRIGVNGMVRVPEDARLIIVPGTVVEFTRKDTNRDTIGENGLQIQGRIIAKGTKEHPILFRSAEQQRKMGDWDSINIMNSDKAMNLIEHCRIEDAYRGLHFHFSLVTVANVVLRNNYRGVQFQESVVTISGSRFYRNKSGLQARDSDIAFFDNVIANNYTGMNVFRNNITVQNNQIVQNYQEGVRVREGLPLVERNLIDGNRHGLMMNDELYGSFTSNVVSHNLESGISLKNTENVEISGNAVQGNGLNGMNIQDASAVIRGNLISDNGERGIGVLSFQGEITQNNIVRNGRYNLGIDGTTDVSARQNWWGGGDVKKTIYDKANEPSRGRVEHLPMRDRPVLFSWPLKNIRTDAAWHGDISIGDRLTVDPGAELVISPGTRVLFAKNAGLTVRGRIIAQGDTNAMIAFTSAGETSAGAWDEILIDHAAGSVFTNCVFQHATWALHSHFTDLKVAGCSFTRNYGGMRFTSGPLEVRQSFFGSNEIGIRAFRGSALITGNTIEANRIGIFVREKGGGLTVRKNNIAANVDYNIRLGDLNAEDVDARDNWWGGPAPAEKIYDARTEPGIGLVRYEPYAKQPFAVESMVGSTPDGKAGGAHAR